MDSRIETLLTKFAAYTAKVDAYVAAAEAYKMTVADQVAAAVAKDDADEAVDFAVLDDTIAAAAAKFATAETPVVPELPAEPSG